MKRSFARNLVVALLVAVGVPATFADPVPTFALKDLNPRSVRFSQMISPQDYHLQVSAYYFGSAG